MQLQQEQEQELVKHENIHAHAHTVFQLQFLSHSLPIFSYGPNFSLHLLLFPVSFYIYFSLFQQ